MASFVAAHVRLIYSGNGKVLYWSDPTDISVVINKTGSDNISGDGHFTALRNAISAWNSVDGTTAKLIEDTSPSEQASTNWASDSRHLLLFDENNSSGYFPGSSGIVAVTPLTFYTYGRIIDADVLFNGKSYQFTTEGTAWRFDVQDVATHELGHLLGLDHSGCVGASMYPYVDQSVILHRSLSLDDIHGLQDMYPAGTFSRIKGTLTRASNSSPVRGAWVGARDANGRVVGAILSNALGQFTLPSLTPGTYTVYVTPLDEPVSASNFTAGHDIQTNFEAKVLGAVSLGGSETVDMGSFALAGDVSVELGRVADNYPLRTTYGQANALTVRGSGLTAGSTLTCSDPSVTLSGVKWNGHSVTFTATPAAGAALGHVDLEVTTGGGDTHILSAGLEITPPDPVVSSVTPATGDADGGTFVTITGSNFNPRCRIVIGDRRYIAGWSATVVDSNTITLTTFETLPGLHDVVVIDESGVEGRGNDAFEAVEQTTIASIFPTAGVSTGGTVVRINGGGFVPGTSVTIDGVFQTNTTINSSEQIIVVTDSGVVGGPYVLEVEGPNGQTAAAAYVYTTKADPVLVSVSPDGGSSAGGETVTLRGAGFTRRSEVVFGAMPKSGLGGAAAPTVVLIDSTTLQVSTPATSTTSKSVMVRESDTGQASMLAGVFTFAGEPSGGGCAALVPAAPPTWRRAVGGAGWVVVLAALLAWRARRSACAVLPYAACPARNG
jgi:hypothetical protein